MLIVAEKRRTNSSSESRPFDESEIIMPSVEVSPVNNTSSSWVYYVVLIIGIIILLTNKTWRNKIIKQTFIFIKK